MNVDSGCSNTNPAVVLAVDEPTAMPLAATKRSLLENLSPDKFI
jgi:hypothetical protein